jgi:transcriptional regulator with XRE-family HTH domain
VALRFPFLACCVLEYLAEIARSNALKLTWTHIPCPEHFVPMTPFASKLRSRAAELGLSNAEVARRAGLSERRYGNYVLGRTEPDLAALGKIARALGLTPNDLLGFSSAGPATIDGRISLALPSLRDDDLEVVLVQIEALARERRR